MSALGRLMKAQMARRGSLPWAQFETLRFISEESSPTMHDIARYHGITAPSVTAHVSELVRAGYLTRLSDEKDRRTIRLNLTARGKRALTVNIEKRRKIIETLFKKLGENDRVAFNRILGKITNN